MSENHQDIKTQRDRFLAFAFASADLFLEIDEHNKITFAIGAAKGITGLNSKDMLGTNWLDMFSQFDHANIESLFTRTKTGHRQGPMLFDLNENITTQKGILTCIKMPGSDRLYVTLAFSDAISSHIAELTSAVQSKFVLDLQSFTLAAEEAIIKAKAIGKDIKISVFDFAPTEGDQERFGEEKWNNLTEGLGNILLESSIDGRTAGFISDGRYSIIQDDLIDTLIIQEKLEEFAKTQDPEGLGVKMKSKSVDADLKTINERDIAKSVVYTIREFERKGSDLTIKTLNTGFDEYKKANSEKVEELKSFLGRSDFKINFQPIINFQENNADHYEMRCYFEHGNTQEWVMFGEDLGMASEFDLAICERAMNYINFKAATTRTKFSINISGQSFDDESFFPKLIELLERKKGAINNITDRLMFEITESLHIKNVQHVGRCIQTLRGEGYTIALDDFEADETSFKNLKILDVDTIKVDGKIIGKILSSQPDLALMKKIAQTCQDMNKTIIAKSIEDQKQIDLLRHLGINLGQGFLFGELTADPAYTITV